MRRLIRENPNTGTPERLGNVLRRLTLGASGLSLTGILIFQALQEHLSGGDNYVSPLALTGLGMATVAIALEISERYPRKFNGGGYSKQWEPPLLPLNPGPSGVDIDTLIYETETFLASKIPASV